MIIAVASQKGGTGKTTTSISLASGLARLGKKVLLIDLDSQANASKVLIPDYGEIKKDDTLFSTILHREPLKIKSTKIDNLDLVPSHILVANTDIELTVAKDHREARLKTALDGIRDNYDYIFIDCPPSLSWLTLNGFTAADKVLVVVSPGYFELESIVQMIKSMTDVQEYYNPDLQLLGFLFTMSDPTVNSRTSLKLLRQTYTEDVIKVVIPRNTDIRDAHFEQKDIYSYNPNAKSAVAYQSLIKELFL